MLFPERLSPANSPAIQHFSVVETIVARKDVEEALRESVERQRLAVEAAHMGTYEWNLPEDILIWSPRHEELFGYAPGGFGGTYQDFAARVHAGDLRKVEAEIARCIAARTRFEAEFRVIWPDGSAHWLESTGEFTFGPDGSPQRMYGVVMETTERRLAEQERQQVFQRITDAFVALDKDWNFTFVNGKAGEMLGCDAKSLIGKNLREGFPESHGLRFQQIHEQAMIDQQPVFLEEYYPSFGRWFENRIYPSPEGLSIYLHDITKRKCAEQALAASRDQLRALLARLQQAREDERLRVSREIHDELGQLLTSLKMDVRWLEERLSSPELPASLNPLLDRAVSASELADATIATVQKIAAELRPGVLDHLGLAATLDQEARRFEDRSGVRCVVTEDPSWTELPAEIESELFYIAQEALTNVARHADAKRVDLFLRSEGDEAVLEVVDDGVGISRDDLDVPTSLGLLGMEERAAQCGGVVRISRNEPTGTRITVRIPRAGNRREGG